MQKQLLAPDLDFAEHAGRGQLLEVCASSVPIRQAGADHILNSTMRLQEQQLDQFAAVEALEQTAADYDSPEMGDMICNASHRQEHAQEVLAAARL
jgi:hypothetical protein